MMVKIRLKGFVLKELFITLLVILGLFAMAFPAYRDYMRRDYYKEIVDATEPFKIAVDKCFKKLKTFTGCNAGRYAIPAAITKSHGALASMTVTNGIIIATPVPRKGVLETDTYVLTPKIVNDELTWIPSGEGLLHGYTG
ncbi:MAG TPA: pilus assembly protein [Gammaproteobacteria bacterium]|nr:pilus assembly protein [Gammaproteobacteria bacterium]